MSYARILSGLGALPAFYPKNKFAPTPIAVPWWRWGKDCYTLMYESSAPGQDLMAKQRFFKEARVLSYSEAIAWRDASEREIDRNVPALLPPSAPVPKDYYSNEAFHERQVMYGTAVILLKYVPKMKKWVGVS